MALDATIVEVPKPPAGRLPFLTSAGDGKGACLRRCSAPRRLQPTSRPSFRRELNPCNGGQRPLLARFSRFIPIPSLSYLESFGSEAYWLRQLVTEAS